MQPFCVFRHYNTESDRCQFRRRAFLPVLLYVYYNEKFPFRHLFFGQFAWRKNQFMFRHWIMKGQCAMMLSEREPDPEREARKDILRGATP